MSKREKIIVVLMILSVLYGVYVLFFEKQTENSVSTPTVEDTSLDQFVLQISSALKGGGGSDADAYVLARAEKTWGDDPFLSAGSVLTQEVASPEKIEESLPVFAYSGYVRMGNRNLAIIDGQEYGVGEILEPGGFVVKKITPVQVVLSVSDGRPDVVLVLEDTQ